MILEIDHQLPESLKFLHGRTYQAYAAGGDLAGVIFLVGIGWAIGRRYVQRPYRIRIKTKPEDAAILGTFLVIGVTGFFTEAVRIALEGRPDVREVVVRRISALGPRRRLVARARCATRTGGCGRVHVVAFLAFLAILPTTKLRHMFTSPMNMYLRTATGPRAR